MSNETLAEIREAGKALAQAQELKVEGNRITSPGPFEMSDVSILVFHDAYMNGDRGEEIGSRANAYQYSEGTAILATDDNGFWYLSLCEDPMEYAEARAAYEEEEEAF